eukprot:gene12825-26704_t
MVCTQSDGIPLEAVVEFPLVDGTACAVSVQVEIMNSSSGSSSKNSCSNSSTSSSSSWSAWSAPDHFATALPARTSGSRGSVGGKAVLVRRGLSRLKNVALFGPALLHGSNACVRGRAYLGGK